MPWSILKSYFNVSLGKSKPLFETMPEPNLAFNQNSYLKVKFYVSVSVTPLEILNDLVNPLTLDVSHLIQLVLCVLLLHYFKKNSSDIFQIENIGRFRGYNWYFFKWIFLFICILESVSQLYIVKKLYQIEIFEDLAKFFQMFFEKKMTQVLFFGFSKLSLPKKSELKWMRTNGW